MFKTKTLTLMILTFFLTPERVFAELAGNPESVSMAHSIVEAAGGHEAWANLVFLNAKIRGYRAYSPTEVFEDFLTELRVPNTLFSMKK